MSNQPVIETLMFRSAFTTPRAGSVRKRGLRTLPILLLLLVLLLPAVPPALAGEIPVIYTTFVGNQVIDLLWNPYSGYHYYRVLRGGNEIFRTTNTDELWYRDNAVSKGGTYSYVLCVGYNWGEEYCGYPATATAGQVKGNLFQDLVWSGGLYELYSDVRVWNAARLTISGANVQKGGTTQPSITTDPEAVLEIDGATLNVGVNISPAGGYVHNSVLQENTSLYVKGDASIAGNQFQGNNHISLGSTEGIPEIELSDNDVYSGRINAMFNGIIDIWQNRFYGQSQISVSGDTDTRILDNTFIGDPQYNEPTLSLTSAGRVEVRRNRFRNPRFGISVTGNSHALIEQNVFQGPGNADYSRAIYARYTQPPTTTGVLIYDNIIKDWERGIHVDGCAVQVEDNRIVDNETGIDVDGDGACTIQQNCIGGNQSGLEISNRTQTVVATQNYWGAPSGPTHPDNPGGRGDAINGGPVDFSPWLQQGDCSVADLSIAGLEIVQVVQDLRNSMPLVAGKKTVVRAYPDSAVGTIPGVTGELRAYRDGQFLGSRAPDAPISAVPIVDINSRRAQKSGGLLFRLPPEWITDTITLTLDLTTTAQITETSLRNNAVTYTVDFAPRQPLRLAYVPISYQPDPSKPAQLPDLGEMLGLHGFVQELYPLAEVVPEFLGTIPWYLEMTGMPTETELARGDVLLDLLTFIYLGANAKRPAGRQFDQIVGIFPDGTTRYGQSDPRWDRDGGGRGGQGRAVYCGLAGSTLAHEIGHNLGLRHPGTPDACNAQDPNSYWPAVYDDATMQEYGYNFVLDEVVGPAAPNQHYDLMSYCTPVWISPLHYRMLYNADRQPQAIKGGEPTQAEQNYLVAMGRVQENGTVEFLPFWQISSTVPLGNPPAGSDYCLELRDAANAVLQGHCFDLDFFNYQGQISTTEDSFVVALSLAPTATQAVLRQGALDLGQVALSAHPPNVTLLSPNGGETASDPLVIEWSASDDDGDPLAYNLFYSADDGASWQPLAINLTGTSTLSVPLALLPGSSAARVKVEASDGFNNAADRSDGSFSVVDRAPIASILHPVTGSWALPPLTLQGSAYDLEDGLLEDSALNWHSDRDGALGTGGELCVESLSLGWHTLTLNAIDSQGNSGGDAIRLKVGIDIYLPLLARGG
ncbi:MAG: hypothetical protein JXA37_14755 [Chloroflexia bacterium]|nr:hypothetical protein [Chloroflexia bacterium]